MNDRSPPRLDVPVLIVWLAIQIGALALCAGRVPFSARYARPAEDHALIVMMIAQQTFAALLMPRLLASRIAATTISAVLPFTCLAAYLGQDSFGIAVICLTCTALWLLALTAWCFALRSTRGRLLASAVFTALALSGPLLDYLESEYGSGASTISHLHVGPINATVAALSKDYTSFLVQISVLFLTAMAVRIYRRHEQTSYPQKFSTTVDSRG
jgi:hypothetical protein